MTTMTAGAVKYGAPQRVLEVKAAGDAWECSGYCSTFGNVDLGGDVVERGAFRATLASGNPVRFQFNHDSSQILGVPLELREDAKGLFGVFRISRTRLGEDIHTLLVDKAITAYSIGYLPVDHERDRDGVRHLKAVELLEVSLVAHGMNPAAVVTAAKAQGAHRPPSPVLGYFERAAARANRRLTDARLEALRHSGETAKRHKERAASEAFHAEMDLFRARQRARGAAI
jgi:hypothetical protein